MTDRFQISLAAARVNANLTQEQAANELHKSKTTIVNWESGKSFPDINEFKKLCALYRCPEDAIFLGSATT